MVLKFCAPSETMIKAFYLSGTDGTAVDRSLVNKQSGRAVNTDEQAGEVRIYKLDK